MLENSLKPSAYFELSHRIFYDADAELCEDLGTDRPGSPTRALLQHISGFTLGCDFCFLIAAFAALPFSPFKGPSFLDSILISLFLTISSLVIFYLTKLYRLETIANFRSFCGRFLLIIIAVPIGAEVENFMVSPAPGHAFAFPEQPLGWAGLTLCLFIAMRFAISEVFRLLVARGYASHNVVVIGTSPVAESFIKKLHGNGLGVRVRAVFEDNFSVNHAPDIAGITVSGGLPALLQYTKHQPIDTVVIASESPVSFNLKALVEQISVQPLRVAILPSHLVAGEYTKTKRFGWCAPAGRLPGVNLVHLADPPIGGMGGFMKSALDLTAALVAVLLFAPLMLICAVGIKLASPGPVFFMQRRIGYRNKEFLIFKFRTMHVKDSNNGVLTQRNDARVFKFGQFMRKFSLDELPQLFNVLRGEMSLVGPRPHIQEARAAGILYFKAVPNYPARHRVKPGITGHAQISGWRGPTETIEQIENRVAHDLHYVENWSFFGDIKILAKTLCVGFFGENAF